MIEIIPKSRKDNIKIATVYARDPISRLKTYTMDVIRWFKISEALAGKGFNVDIIINHGQTVRRITPQLRYVPYSKVNWNKYDVIKTLFHEGFESLISEGGGNHPFVISKLGSIVGGKKVSGVHFYGNTRKKLYATQKEINSKSKYITILTEASKNLWENEFGKKNNILLVPTGVDSKIPPPMSNPYKKFKEKIVLFTGNIYGNGPFGGVAQENINRKWQYRLNAIGKLLKRKEIRLCFLGVGDTNLLNPKYVTYMGCVENNKIWDYHYYADVGLVLAEGERQHNEKSKIYYYLRAGLPVVSEAPVPNNNLIKEARLGLIATYCNNRMLVDLIEEAIHKKWDKNGAINYIVKNHTWDKRAEIYVKTIYKEFK